MHRMTSASYRVLADVMNEGGAHVETLLKQLGSSLRDVYENPKGVRLELVYQVIQEAVRRTGKPDLGLLAAMGVIGTFTQGAYIRGMQAGEAAVMAPIDYTRLVFSAAIGFAIFNEVPTWATIAGAAIVVVSTLFITLREHQLSKRAGA